MKKEKWQKLAAGSKIWWLKTDKTGTMIFSFDRIHAYNLFTSDYDKLTPEQKKLFAKEHPDLAALKK
jgi:hypothetical protein